jgi:hypothetical protein
MSELNVHRYAHLTGQEKTANHCYRRTQHERPGFYVGDLQRYRVPNLCYLYKAFEMINFKPYALIFITRVSLARVMYGGCF